MRPTRRDLLLVTAALLAGCSHGQKTLTLGYTDRDHLFAVELRNAWPAARGPSSGGRGLAARLGGNVCGTDIAFDAEYWGRFMSLTGFASNSHSKGDNVSIVIINGTTGDTAWTPGQGDARPVTLEVRDEVRGGVSSRRLVGSIGLIAGQASLGRLLSRNPTSHAVDIVFNRDALAGDVGLRRYDLHRVDDDLLGHFTMYGREVPFVVRGADELWSMPAAAQAAILPLLLTCTEETRVVQRIDFRN